MNVFRGFQKDTLVILSHLKMIPFQTKDLAIIFKINIFFFPVNFKNFSDLSMKSFSWEFQVSGFGHLKLHSDFYFSINPKHITDCIPLITIPSMSYFKKWLNVPNITVFSERYFILIWKIKKKLVHFYSNWIKIFISFKFYVLTKKVTVNMSRIEFTALK